MNKRIPKFLVMHEWYSCVRLWHSFRSLLTLELQERHPDAELHTFPPTVASSRNKRNTGVQLCPQRPLRVYQTEPSRNGRLHELSQVFLVR